MHAQFCLNADPSMFVIQNAVWKPDYMLASAVEVTMDRLHLTYVLLPHVGFRL